MLRPGGVFINADHMPDDGLPELTERLQEQARTRRDARHATAAAPSWAQWWQQVAADPDLGSLAREREELFGQEHAAEFMPPASWHLETLRALGYREVGLVWRGSADAAVAAQR